ncbi:MAG: hypothetical protein HY717_02060 [Planctomycetes bacterium]|nr:hypothetical protein [Planctomycetota bacterium]
MSKCWNVPAIPQRTPELCWDACLRMMLRWRNPGMDAGRLDARYLQAAGQYLRENRGLADYELDVLAGRLGLVHDFEPTIASLLARLDRGPVLFYMSYGPMNAHSVVAIWAQPPDNSVFCVVDPWAAGGIPIGPRRVPRSWIEADIAGGYIWAWS